MCAGWSKFPEWTDGLSFYDPNVNHDPYNPFSEKALGLAAMGTIFFCASSGTGIGVFFEKPEIGALAGGLVGIIVAVFLLPALMRDWQD